MQTPLPRIDIEISLLPKRQSTYINLRIEPPFRYIHINLFEDYPGVTCCYHYFFNFSEGKAFRYIEIAFTENIKESHSRLKLCVMYLHT
jgi:hypothetical protein